MEPSTNGHAAVVVEVPSRIETRPQTGVARLVDHSFTPRRSVEPWGLCRCGLAESAHMLPMAPYEVFGRYRCPECVSDGASACGHQA